MANYSWRNKKTGHISSIWMTIAEAEQYEKDHPELTWLCGAPALADPWRVGVKKPSNRIRDRLKDIKKKHPLGTVETY